MADSGHEWGVCVCADVGETPAAVSCRSSSTPCVYISADGHFQAPRHPAAFCTQVVSQVGHLPHRQHVPPTLEVNFLLLLHGV